MRFWRYGMNIKIGAVIKKLRAEHHITQEKLATAIGVTPQAISRWESETSYPDIELLPALADFFSVSTDVLLGYKLSEREQEIMGIKKEMVRLAEVGTTEERIAFARNALARYPSEHAFKEHLATSLYHMWYETRDSALFTEIESLCASILSNCNDEDSRYNAINLLVCLYGGAKQSEKAMDAVNLLTPMKYCREFAKSSGIGDGNTELYIQDEIDKLTDALGTAITSYAVSDELPNDPSTWDKKIDMLNISNTIYPMIYGDNLMFYHVRLAHNHWLISTYEMAQGKAEEALASLEKTCHHTVEYDKAYLADHGKRYTSIFTDKLIYPEPSRDFHELTAHTQCYHALEKLQHKRYDRIRNDPRFLAIEDTLREFAK